MGGCIGGPNIRRKKIRRAAVVGSVGKAASDCGPSNHDLRGVPHRQDRTVRSKMGAPLGASEGNRKGESWWKGNSEQLFSDANRGKGNEQNLLLMRLISNNYVGRITGPQRTDCEIMDESQPGGKDNIHGAYRKFRRVSAAEGIYKMLYSFHLRGEEKIQHSLHPQPYLIPTRQQGRVDRKRDTP